MENNINITNGFKLGFNFCLGYCAACVLIGGLGAAVYIILIILAQDPLRY